MREHDTLNLALDFGVPDEAKLAQALADGDFETAGRLYSLGVLMSDPGFELQDFLEEVERGLSLSDEAIQGYAKRIYTSLAMTDMEKDPLSQNVLYQMTLNALSSDSGEATIESRLITALMKFPFTKTEKNSVVGAMMEASWDNLDEILLDPSLNEAFIVRAKEVFGEGRFERYFATHGLIRHFDSDKPSQETTLSLLSLLLNRSPAFTAVQKELVEKHRVESPDRLSLAVMLHALKKTMKSEWQDLLGHVYRMEEMGYDIKQMTSSVETKEEYSLLSADLEMDSRYFDPRSIKPHMVDHVFATDLGL